MEKIELEILGLSIIPTTGAFIIILREIGGIRHLPLMIGGSEANSIATELNGVKIPRPMTHDLIRNMILELNLTLNDVTITEINDGIFYSKLNIETMTKKVEIDSRPSDSFAIAIRLGVPIYVMSDILQSYGFTNDGDIASVSLEAAKILMGIDDVKVKLEEKFDIDKIAEEIQKNKQKKKQQEKSKPTKKSSKTTNKAYSINELELTLESLIKNENYEEAAKVRDELAKIKRVK